VKSGWQYVLNESSLQFLLGCRLRDRNQLIHAIEKLAENPAQRGDWLAKDSTGRQIHVKRFGSFILSYWILL